MAGAPKVPADLANHSCLTFRAHPGSNVWRFRGPGGVAEARVSGSLFATDGEVLTAAAVAGPSGDVKKAVAAMQRGDWRAAVQLWTKAIDSGRLDRRRLVPVYGTRATSYMKLNQPIEALADFSRSLELAPGSSYPSKYIAYTYSNRARLYVLLKRYRLAIQDGDKAIGLNPQNALGYYYRGRAREMLGQRVAAITDFRAVLRIRPNHKSSRAALAPT